MFEGNGHGGESWSKEVRETWCEQDREERMENEALGGQGSISTPEKMQRSVE